jgi:hypothetical protein
VPQNSVAIASLSPSAEGGVRRSSDGRSGGAGQQGGGGGGGGGVGAERGVVERQAGDCDVPRGDRRADVVAVNERREGLSFHARNRDSEKDKEDGAREKNERRAAVHVGKSSQIWHVRDLVHDAER